MGMCKGCGEVFGSKYLYDGYCKTCESKGLNVAAKVEQKPKKKKEKTIRGDVICEDCGTIGTARNKVAGAFWVELLLYILGIIFAAPTFFISLLVPLGYSIHRRTGSTKVCKECGGKVVSIYTPRGEKLLKEMGFVEA